MATTRPSWKRFPGMTVAVLASGPGAAVRVPSLLPTAAPAAGVRRNALAGEEQNAGLDALRRVAPARREMASRLLGEAPGLRRDAIRRNLRAPLRQ